jgi:hypothetical protein
VSFEGGGNKSEFSKISGFTYDCEDSDWIGDLCDIELCATGSCEIVEWLINIK